MESLKKIDFKKISIPKAIGVFIIAIVIFVIVTSLVGFALRTAFVGPNFASRSYDGYSVTAPYYGDDAMEYAYEESAQKLSLGNVMPPTPGGGHTTGSDAESFEITEYNGFIETGSLDRSCDTIENLKALEYVIFENANRNDRNCNYVFKVENEHASEILEIIKDLKPESLNENTHTIKTLVDDYSSEIEILEKKLTSVEETLLDAQRAYDEVEVLATRTQDVESLAKIIDSKIGLIERLTTERITIKERIDRINKQKADQIDRLNFTFFRLHVVEDHIIDLEGLKESWEWEIKRFVNEFNEVLQKITINLVGFILQLGWIALYLIFALFVLKYGWRGAKYMWKK